MVSSQAIIYGITHAGLFLIIWIISIVVHEIGHTLMLKMLKKDKSKELGDDIKVEVRKKWKFWRIRDFKRDLSYLSNAEYRAVALTGVILGFLPLLIAYYSDFVWYEIGLLVVLYFSGCLTDLKGFFSRHLVSSNDEKAKQEEVVEAKAEESK